MTGDVNPVNNEDHLSWKDQILGNLEPSQGVETLYTSWILLKITQSGQDGQNPKKKTLMPCQSGLKATFSLFVRHITLYKLHFKELGSPHRYPTYTHSSFSKEEIL